MSKVIFAAAGLCLGVWLGSSSAAYEVVSEYGRMAYNAQASQQWLLPGLAASILVGAALMMVFSVRCALIVLPVVFHGPLFGTRMMDLFTDLNCTSLVRAWGCYATAVVAVRPSGPCEFRHGCVLVLLARFMRKEIVFFFAILPCIIATTDFGRRGAGLCVQEADYEPGRPGYQGAHHFSQRSAQYIRTPRS